MFPRVHISTSMEQPFRKKVHPFEEAKYYRDHLESQTPISLASTPAAAADWLGVYGWSGIFCVSREFMETFDGLLAGYWIETSSMDHFLFIPDNIIDSFGDGTVIHNEREKPFWYESILNETFNELAQNQFLFSVPQEPGKLLSTSKFEDLYRVRGFSGIQFYKEINFKRANGERFDGMRFGRYDDEGNYLGR